MRSFSKTIGLCALLAASQISFAQKPVKLSVDSLPSRDPAIAATPAGIDKNELKYNLNTSGTHFIKATFLNQAWLRFNQSNPGSTVIQEPNTSTVDIGLRRTRMQVFGQLSDHVFVYFQFGLNNFNYLNGGFSPTAASNRKFQPFFHDAVGEYLVFKNRNLLNIGYGLTIVNGLSRFSGPSVATIMSMDVPVFAQATVDQTDEFARKLSLYARGQVGRLDYRLAMSDPFPIQTSGAALPSYSQNAQFALKGHRKQYQGFFMWQFFDKEAHQTPGYNTGTYLGARKILNLEAGFITQQRATATTAGSDTLYHPMNLWSVASFLDMPLNKTTGTAINAYLGYFSTNYGPNYLRFNGIMNPASGVATGFPAGTQGNAFPMFGTGSVIYGQVGYLMKRDLFGAGRGTLMPYAQAQIASYNRVTQPLGVYNLGVNYLINGHNAKFTLDYQNRPSHRTDGNQFTPSGRRGQLTLQYQLFI